MSWSEFCTLLSGLMPETPLGQIVSVRAEKDPKTIAKFSPEQKRIRNEWIKKKNHEMQQNPVAFAAWEKSVQDGFKAMCGVATKI